MATMLERLAQVHQENPGNLPIHPNRLGMIWFKDIPGYHARPANHNGGLRKGPTIALGLVARMAKKGMMERWIDPEGCDKRSLWRISTSGLAMLGAQTPSSPAKQQDNISSSLMIFAETGGL